MQNELLRSPIEQLSDIELIFGRTRKLMYPAKFLEHLA
jgi:hypothetical protein